MPPRSRFGADAQHHRHRHLRILLEHRRYLRSEGSGRGEVLLACTAVALQARATDARSWGREGSGRWLRIRCPTLSGVEREGAANGLCTAATLRRRPWARSPVAPAERGYSCLQIQAAGLSRTCGPTAAPPQVSDGCSGPPHPLDQSLGSGAIDQRPESDEEFLERGPLLV
jgi:hypothetical protein